MSTMINDDNVLIVLILTLCYQFSFIVEFIFILKLNNYFQMIISLILSSMWNVFI